MTPEACAARRFELALHSPRLRAVVLGEAPGRSSNPGVPCTGRLGQALARMIGWSFDAYLARTARANLLPAWPPAAGVAGQRRPRVTLRRVTSARLSWKSTWLPTLAAHAPAAPLLLLGTRVAAALRVRGGLLAESVVGGHRALVVPHPQGRGGGARGQGAPRVPRSNRTARSRGGPNLNIRKSGAVLALLLVACDEPPRGPEFRVATDPPTPRIEPPIEAGAPRFRVTFAQFFHDELAYGKERGVYVLTDARDGREYVLVTGCCVAELCAHPIGRSTAPDER